MPKRKPRKNPLEESPQPRADAAGRKPKIRQREPDFDIRSEKQLRQIVHEVAGEILSEQTAQLERLHDKCDQLTELVGVLSVTLAKLAVAANLGAGSSSTARIKIQEFLESAENSIRYEFIPTIDPDAPYEWSGEFDEGYDGSISSEVISRVSQMMARYRATLSPSEQEDGDFSLDFGEYLGDAAAELDLT